MFELTIDGKVYQFKFGMGFMRDVNKRVSTTVDGLPDAKRNLGLQYLVAGVMDGDVEALVDILEAANKGFDPRATREKLDAYIDEVEDIDALFDTVLDFLEKTNATKKTMAMLKKEIAKAKAKEEAEAKAKAKA